MALRLVPITLRVARRFVGEHHRHNVPPKGWRFGVGVEDSAGELVGVAIASRPVARALDDGETLEIVRTCTNGARNANSMLYGAIARAAKPLGYRRVITYTLASEPGTSLRAAGFMRDGEVAARPSWSTPTSGRSRYQQDLFGNERRSTKPKMRWIRMLTNGGAAVAKKT